MLLQTYSSSACPFLLAIMLAILNATHSLTPPLFASHQLFLRPLSSAYQTYNIALPSSYDNTYDRFVYLGGYKITRRSQIKIHIDLRPHVSDSSVTVGMAIVNGFSINTLSIFILFVKQNNRLAWATNQSHDCTVINSYGGTRTQNLNVPITIAIPNKSEMQINFFLSGYDSMSQSSAPIKVTINSVVYDSSASNAIFNFILTSSNQRLFYVNVVLLLVNTTAIPQEKLYNFQQTHSLNKNTLLSQATFDAIPTILRGSSGFDGYCLFGITSIQLEGLTFVDAGRSLLFDITKSSSIFTELQWGPSWMNFAIELHWKCLMACPNSTYYDTNNACLDCSPGCTQCTNATCCTICPNDTMILDSAGCCQPCSIFLDNCLNCNDNSTCTSCLNNSFAVNNTAYCEPCSILIPMCSTCFNHSFCNSCENLTYFYNSTSIACQLCSSALSNCQTCSSVAICLTCNSSNNFINVQVCSPCSLAIPKCLSCHTNTSVPLPYQQMCDSCQDTYFPDPITPACLYCPNATGTCLTCLSINYCMSCVNDSLGVSGNNLCLPCEFLIRNCVRCVNSSYCLECLDQTFYLSLNNVLCMPCTISLPNCQTCQNGSVCLTCFSITHFVDSSNYCSPCQTVLPNCQECQVDLLVPIRNCTLCDSTFLINSSLMCESCSSFMPNCLYCTREDYCDQCIGLHAFNSNSNNSCYPCSTLYTYCVNCNNSQCLTCQPQMKLSGNWQECYCIVGWIASDMCTTIVGCTQPVVYADQCKGCLTCNISQFYLQPRDDVCVCLEGTLLQEHCNIVDGCIVANGRQACRYCNSMQGFLTSPDSQGLCVCQDLLFKHNVSCIDLCGDGFLAKRIGNNCDDGNMIEGDGCSAKCQVEISYRCQNGSATSPSSCKYIGIPITLTQRRVERTEGLNQGIFKFNVKPPLINIAKMNFSNFIQFTCDATFTVSEISYSQGVLSVVADYSTDMEDRSCNLTMSFDPLLFKISSSTISFTAASQTAPLVISDNLETYFTFKMVFKYLSLAVLGVFVLSMGHKMIGAEFLVSCQIVYYSSGLYNKTPLFITSITKFKAVTGSAFFYQQSYSSILEPFSNHIEISPYFIENTLVVGGLLVFFFACWLILFVVKQIKAYSPQNQKNTKARQRQVFQLFRLYRFIYRCLLFPLTAGFIMILWLSAYLNSKRIPILDDSIVSPSMNNIMVPVILFIAAMVVGLQCAFSLAIKVPSNKSVVFEVGGQQDTKRWYIPLFLVRCLLIVCALVFYIQKPSVLSVAIIWVILLIFWLTLLIGRPHSLTFDNLGAILGQSVALYAVSLSLLSYFVQLLEQIWIFVVMILIILISVSMIITLIRSAIVLVQTVKKLARSQRDEQLQGQEKIKVHKPVLSKFQLYEVPDDDSPKKLCKGRGKKRPTKEVEMQQTRVNGAEKQQAQIQDELLKAAKQRLKQNFLQHKAHKRKMLQ